MSNVRLFQKGQSGNPTGTTSYLKSLHYELKNKCAEIAINSVHILKGIIYNPEEKGSVRVAAWNILADRGYGKALQTVIMDEAEGKDPKMLTKHELDSYLANDAIATFISMYQRGDSALIEAMKKLNAENAKSNKQTVQEECPNAIDEGDCSDLHCSAILVSTTNGCKEQNGCDENSNNNNSIHNLTPSPST